MAMEYDIVTQTFVDLATIMFSWAKMTEYSSFILLMSIFIVAGILLMYIPFPSSKYIGAMMLGFFFVDICIFSFSMELTFDFKIFGYTIKGMADILAILEIIAVLFLLIFTAIQVLGGWIGVGKNHWLIIITWALVVVVQICLLQSPAIILSCIIAVGLYAVLAVVKLVMDKGKKE